MKKAIQRTNETGRTISDEEAVRQLAYELWRARGCPIGSPEDDWYAAEEQLNQPKSMAVASAA